MPFHPLTMDEVLMVPKQEFNQLMQFYKGQLLEDPILEKSAHLAVPQHQLLTNPAIPPGQKKALVKPLGNELYHMKKKLTTGQSSHTDEEDKPPPAFAKYTPPLPKKVRKRSLANLWWINCVLCQAGKIGRRDYLKSAFKNKWEVRGSKKERT